MLCTSTKYVLPFLQIPSNFPHPFHKECHPLLRRSSSARCTQRTRAPWGPRSTRIWCRNLYSEHPAGICWGRWKWKGSMAWTGPPSSRAFEPEAPWKGTPAEEQWQQLRMLRAWRPWASRWVQSARKEWTSHKSVRSRTGRRELAMDSSSQWKRSVCI